MGKDAIQILKERAEAAAHVEEQVAIATVPLSLFVRGKQHYGLRLGEVEGAGRLRQLSPVPGSPPWMMGAVQHRGSILTLLDLAPFWGVESGPADLPTFIVAGDRGRRSASWWRSWWACWWTQTSSRTAAMTGRHLRIGPLGRAAGARPLRRGSDAG
jgi:hypothetical protein